MKIDEKLELLARAIRGEVKIEVNGVVTRRWYPIWYKNNIFESNGCTWTMEYLLDNPLREVKKLPLLSQDECEFLKWFPQSWWIAKDDYCIFLYSEKPKKTFSHWFDGGDRYGLNMPTFPKFNGLTLLDEDCYTIGELIAYAKSTHE